jgi:hypothetical protein
MDPLTMALIAGGGAALGALPDLIPSKYEREQKKELKDLQRRQELGLLGLTEAERARLEGQLEGRSRQGQAYAQAETARLSAPTAQPQQALLQSQLAAEAAQRQEAEIAQQLLGMDIAKQQAEEQQIRDLEAAQAEYKRRRAEAAVAPFQAGAEAAVGSIATEKLLSLPPQQQAVMLQQQYGLTPQQAQLFSMPTAQPQMSQDAALFQAMYGGR